MGRHGSACDGCDLLERMGAHRAPYDLFCGCRREPLTLFDVALAEALASVPRPRATGGERVERALRPKKIRMPLT